MRITLDAIGIREGGGAQVVTELATWLATVRPQWQFTLLLFPPQWRQFDDPPPRANLIVKHIAHGNSLIGRFFWTTGVRRKFVRDSDVIFSLANIGATNPCRPQVVYVHQMKALQREGLSDLPFRRRLRLRVMSWWILRGARGSNAIIVQTAVMKQLLAALDPSLESKTHVIPSGARTNSQSVSIPPIQATRPWLFYPSLPREHKNHDVLIKAMSQIRATIPTASLLLTVSDEPKFKAGGVVCLGTLRGDQIDVLLKQSDLMIFPSLSESFGLPLAEAMVAGCPVAAADLPYAREVCQNAASFFDPNSPQSLAKCVIELLNDPARLQRLRLETENIRDRYDYHRIAGQIADILSQAADETDSPILSQR